MLEKNINSAGKKEYMPSDWKTPARSAVPVMTPTVRKWMDNLYVMERLYYWIIRTFESLTQDRTDPTYWKYVPEGLKTKSDWRDLILQMSDMIHSLTSKIDMYRRDYDIMSVSERKKMRQQISFVMTHLEANLHRVKNLIITKLPPQQRTMRSATLQTIRDRQRSYQDRRLSQRLR